MLPELAIEKAMHHSERELFLRNFLRHNPQWKGAHVADVLDTLDSTDAYVEVVEQFFDEHHDKIRDKRLTALAVRACIYLSGPNQITWDYVQRIVSQAEKH